MKQKGVFTTAFVLILLCMAFVLSSLTACRNEEFDALKSSVGQLEEDTDDLSTKLADQARELTQKIQEVKDIADAAATAAALNSVVEKLGAVETVANAAATSEALAQAKTALESLMDSKIAAYDPASVASIKTAIENITALQTKLDTVKSTADATKKDLNDLKTELSKINISDYLTKAGLDAAIEALNKYSTKAELTAAKTALENAIKANKDEIASNSAALVTANQKVDALLNKLGTIQDGTTVSAEIEKAIAEIKALRADMTTADSATAKALGDLEAKLTEIIRANQEQAAADLSAAKEELNTKIAENEARSKQNEKALGEAKDAIEALELRCTAIETALWGEDGKGGISKQVADLSDDLSTLTKKVNEELATKVGALEGQMSDLTTRVEALEKDGATKADISDLQSQIDTLKTAVETLSSTVEELDANDFAAKYQEATEALLDGEYSLKAFKETVNEVKPENYAEDDYSDFQKQADDLYFFLGRAISLDQIKGYFRQLDTVIGNMPTLLESLEKMVDSYMTGNEFLTTEETCLDKVIDIHGRVPEEIPETVENNYQTIVAAHENLLEAVGNAADVNDVINGISTPMIYQDSDEEVENAETVYDAYVESFFSNEKYTVLYKEGIAADTFVTAHSKLEDYRARLTELQTAFEAKPAVSDIALNFDEVRPLYSQSEILHTNMTDIETWKSTYRIEDENLSKMYGDTFGMLKTAISYADAMLKLYGDYEVETLMANVKALTEKPMVLYTDYAATVEYYDTLSNLLVDVLAVDAEYGDDVYGTFGLISYKSMTGDLTAFGAVYERENELKEADEAVKAIVVEMEEMKGQVTFTDHAQIKAWADAIKGICGTYEIAVDDENYVVMVADAAALNTALLDEYKVLTAKVAEIYVKVRDILNGTTTWYLKEGTTILEVQAYWNDLLLTIGVENIDLVVPIYEHEDDETTTDVNLSDLFLDQWVECAAQYKTLALHAQEGAKDVTLAIGALSDKKYADLKNYAQVIEVWNSFADWAETYMGVDMNALTAEEALAEVKAVQGIQIHGETENYVFVTTADYQALAAAYTTAANTYDDATAAWSSLKADMTALIDAWSIHSDFASVDAAYTAYVKAYYDGTVNETTDLFGEVDVYTDFFGAMAVYTVKCAEAQNDALAIKNAIADLVDPTMENAEEVMAAVAAIRAKIAAYESNYHCDILDCDKCGITAEEALKLAKYEAKADYTKQYADVYDTLIDDADKARLKSALDTANSTMHAISDVNKVSVAKNFAINALTKFVSELSSGEATE